MREIVKKNLVIGLGNPILRDDGVGIRVAEEIRRRLNGRGDTDITELSVGGIRLMEAMAGYDRVFIIDAVMTGNQPPGAFSRLHIDDLGMSLHTSSTHDTNLACALESGRLAGQKIPSEIVIWGIEAVDVNDFGEQMSGPVEAAVPAVADAVMNEL